MKTVVAVFIFISMCSSSSCFRFQNPWLKVQDNYCGTSMQKPGWAFQKFAPCYSGPPNVANAIVGIINDNPGSFSTVTVKCRPGYLFPDRKPERNLTFECKSWRFEEDCQEINCPNATDIPIENAMFDPASGPYRHLDMLNVTCDTGYVLGDGTTTYMAECTKFGIWNNTETCKKKPCEAPDIDNVVLDPPHGWYNIDDVLHVTCKAGHELADGSTSYVAECLDTGMWNYTDSCTTKSCPVLSIADATLEPPAGPYNYTDWVIVKCDPGYVLSDNTTCYGSQCMEDGTWSTEENCTKVRCEPFTVDNAMLDPDNAWYEYGDMVNVSCDSGYVLSDASSISVTVNCTACGTWDNIPTCSTQKCPAEARPNTKLKDGNLPEISDGITLNLVCDNAYLTSTAETIYESTCERGKWNHSDSCTYNAADACPETVLYNTMLDNNTIPFSVEGTTVTVDCAENKTLPDGSSTSYVTECMAGTWNDSRSCGIKSCQEALDSGLSSGVFKIYPDDALTEMEVYCENTYDGGGWTVIQQRVDDMVDFDRGWTDYENGFGSPTGNFWLGLSNLHVLTTSATFKLVFEITEPDASTKGYACYNTWSIKNSTDLYAIVTPHGFIRGTPNAGNGLFGTQDVAFSTPDMDNDGRNVGADAHCAEYYEGGWWFAGCGQSNLNGPYGSTPPVSGGGLRWRSGSSGGWILTTQSATQSRMMLKVGGC